jgi:hypothetical protein
MPSISTDLRDFIVNYIDSFLTWDLLVFFHTNPGTINGPAELAASLGRKENEIKDSLEFLENKKVLKRKSFRGKNVYFYNPPEEIKEKVERFVKGLDSKNFRFHAISIVLKKGYPFR